MTGSSQPNFDFEYPGYAAPVGVVNFKFGENEYRGFATGIATVQGYGVAWDPIRSITGTATGIGTVVGSFETPTPTVGTSTGASSVSGVGILVQETEGAANGVNLTSGVLNAFAVVSGVGTGSSTATASVIGLIATTGLSSGSSSATGAIGSYAGFTGSASGVATATSVLEGTIQTTGTIEGAGSALASSGQTAGVNFNFNLPSYIPPVNPDFDFIPNKPSGFAYGFATVNGVSSYLQLVTTTGSVGGSAQVIAVGVAIQQQKANNSVVMFLM